MKTLKETLEKGEKLRKEVEDANVKLKKCSGDDREMSLTLSVRFVFGEGQCLRSTGMGTFEFVEHRRTSRSIRSVAFFELVDLFLCSSFAASQKSDSEQQIKDLHERFGEEEQAAQETTNKKLEHSIDGLQKDIGDIWLSLNKAENECKMRDNQIHMLQDEVIAKVP